MSAEKPGYRYEGMSDAERTEAQIARIVGMLSKRALRLSVDQNDTAGEIVGPDGKTIAYKVHNDESGSSAVSLETVSPVSGDAWVGDREERMVHINTTEEGEAEVKVKSMLATDGDTRYKHMSLKPKERGLRVATEVGKAGGFPATKAVAEFPGGSKYARHAAATILSEARGVLADTEGAEHQAVQEAIDKTLEIT